MTESEKELVEKFRSGDAAAFNQIYDSSVERLFRFAYRLTGSREDAEDLTLETYAAFYKARKNFENRSTLQTWLYRIMVFQARNTRKSRKRADTLDIEHLDPDGETDYRLVELFQLISSLPDKLKESFLLVKSEGLTYREASEILKRPTGTIQWEVHQACQKIREQWPDPIPANLTIEACRNEL